jgi:hypothetical protein
MLCNVELRPTVQLQLMSTLRERIIVLPTRWQL